MLRVSLAALALLAALPAAAQDRGGLQLQDRGGLQARNPAAILGQINANQGCPMSVTNVTIGVNQATSGVSSQQQLSRTGSNGPSNCHPLVSTQVVAGVNLATGSGSSAGQTITAQGPRAALATKTVTRGVNAGIGAQSTASQRLSNLIGQ